MEVVKMEFILVNRNGPKDKKDAINGSRAE